MVTMPNFEKWADVLIEAGTVNDMLVGTTVLDSFPDRLEEALNQAFEQGKAFGFNQGFLKGQDVKDVLRNLNDIMEGKG